MGLKNICIIDDDPTYQFICEKIASRSKLVKNVMTFSGGKVALEYFSENIDFPNNLPDAILLDINMPLMNGWQFMDEFISLKQVIKKKIIIYLVTSSAHPADLSRAREVSEIKGYLLKPITYEDIDLIMSTLQH